MAIQSKGIRSVASTQFTGPNRLDWSAVEHAICSRGQDSESRTVRFQRLILEKLFEIPNDLADDHITDGGDDCGIDCFVIDDNSSHVHLISTKTIDAFDKAHKNFPGAEVSKLTSFVRDFVLKNENLLARCNPILKAKISEVWDILDGGRVFQICVHLCSNQSKLTDREFAALQTELSEFRCTAFQHHLAELSDKITRNWSPPISKTVKFIAGKVIEHATDCNDAVIRSLTGYVAVEELASFLKDSRTSLVDENLFHANVRGLLGIQNPVNKDISRSISSNQNSKFFCLNNGITVVCEKYLFQSGGFPVTLHRPQIVNGRQTAETVFDAYRKDPGGTAHALVAVKLIETSDPALIEEISISTNNQSRIGSRDLRANSSIAKKLAASLREQGYYYVRKRGEKSDRSFDLTIDALRAGQLILAYLRELPEKAKTDTASMFGDSFESVFDPTEVTPELLITAHRLYSDIEKEKRSAMLSMRSSGLSATSAEHWLVEGTFHVLYCVSLLARQKAINIANYDDCVPLIPDAVAIVGGYYDGMSRVAAYRLFRNVKARNDLREMISSGLPIAHPSTPQLTFAFSG